MKTQTLIFWLTLIGLLIVSILVYLAVLGYIVAYILLAMMATVFLMGMGEIISLARERIAAQRQQQLFQDNAHENLAIMQELQRIQNEQNKAMLQQIDQLKKMPQLPNGNGNNRPTLLIEDGIFDELD